MDTGSEWAQNKKVVDLSQKDVRSAVSLWFSYLDTLLIEYIRKLDIFYWEKISRIRNKLRWTTWSFNFKLLDFFC